MSRTGRLSILFLLVTAGWMVYLLLSPSWAPPGPWWDWLILAGFAFLFALVSWPVLFGLGAGVLWVFDLVLGTELLHHAQYHEAERDAELRDAARRRGSERPSEWEQEAERLRRAEEWPG